MLHLHQTFVFVGEDFHTCYIYIRHLLLQVRISIHVSGVEQFYMEFNAFGADKIAWFDRSRQISSSSSIPPSTQYYSMIGYVHKSLE